MIQLSYETLAVVISLIGVISAIVMVSLWRINEIEKGLGYWAAASGLGALGFFVILFNPILMNYATFFNNICTLTAPLLTLQGILVFRGYDGNKIREKIIPGIIVLFIGVSFINRGNITRRYLFHDITVTILFFLCAYFLIRGVRGKERNVCIMPIGAFLFISFGFFYRWILALKGAFNSPIGLKHPYIGVLFFIIILWALGWSYGLTLLINHRGQRRILKMATEDDLTGLFNRKNLNDILDDMLSKSPEGEEQYYLYMIDLNGFKSINDTYGHAFGDEVLIMMAKSLKEFVGNSGFAARLGGDEFICVISSIKARKDHECLKGKLRDSIEKVYRIRNLNVQLRTSIGYALIPEHGRTVDQVLDEADRRMYEEKTDTRPMSKIFTL